MGGRLKPKRQRGPSASAPTAEDFTPGAIYRAVLSETVQHPTTLLPATAAALGGLYMALMGLAPVAFAVTFGGALVATGSWIFNYFIRGEALAERHVQRLRKRRRELRAEELRSLEADWSALGHEEGARQAKELRQAYRKLEGFLRRRFAETGGLNLQRLLVLAEDTYREGTVILRAALHTLEALQAVDREKLAGELEAWRSRLSRLEEEGVKEDSPAAAERASLEQRIAAHERRLELYGERWRSVELLLAESETLEAALESTYLEAVDLESPEPLFARGSSASALESAVRAARRVEDRLRSSAGETEKAEDEIYIAASERPGSNRRP